MTLALAVAFLVCDQSAVRPTAPPTAEARVQAQSPSRRKTQKRKPRPFKWVNELKRKKLPGVKHATFRSPSMKLDVGFCIYLPTGYDRKGNTQRYPVVYYLHGGRPGDETRSVGLAAHVHKAVVAKQIPPVIYVFVNGGPVSHYNLPERKHAMGEDVFIKELIPHVDKTWRTIADRKNRAIEGFSQGGRGTARVMFKHPQLFCSAAAGGGGHATEKRISESGGEENPNLKFAPGYNTWDLARKYAKQQQPQMRILIYVGNKGFNYANNLDYMQHLTALKIPHEKLIVDDAPHSANIIYQKRGVEIMQFHAASFRKAAR